MYINMYIYMYICTGENLSPLGPQMYGQNENRMTQFLPQLQIGFRRIISCCGQR